MNKKSTLSGNALSIFALVISVFTFLTLAFPIASYEYFSYYRGYESMTYIGFGFLSPETEMEIIAAVFCYLQLFFSITMITLSIISFFTHNAKRRMQIADAAVFGGWIFSFLYMLIGIVGGALSYFNIIYSYIPFIPTTGVAITYIVMSLDFRARLRKGTQASAANSAPAQNNRPAPDVKPDENGIVYNEVMGAQRSLTVYEDRVSLNQIQNVRALMTNNWFKGEKEIYYADITAVQFRPANAYLLGYIQFEVPGVASDDNFNSENSWTFSESIADVANDIYAYVRKKVAEAKRSKNAPAQQTQPLSAADELLKYKSLLDANLISQEEFEKKKKELL